MTPAQIAEAQRAVDASDADIELRRDSPARLPHADVIPAANFGLAMFISEADVNFHFEQAASRARCDGAGRR
jgi:hypothetical protein